MPSTLTLTPPHTSGLCMKTFGYPGTFMHLVLRICLEWFPWVKPARSRMETTAPLTELEEALATLYFLKSASKTHDQKALKKSWGLTKFKCESMLDKWGPRWEKVSKIYCILDLREDAEFFAMMQPPKFKETYGRVISTELDGTTVVHEKSRLHSLKSRSSYSDKCGHQAGQGLTWTSPIGLVLLLTSLFCGRTSEKSLVKLYADWLWIFPR